MYVEYLINIVNYVIIFFMGLFGWKSKAQLEQEEREEYEREQQEQKRIREQKEVERQEKLQREREAKLQQTRQSINALLEHKEIQYGEPVPFYDVHYGRRERGSHGYQTTGVSKGTPNEIVKNCTLDQFHVGEKNPWKKSGSFIVKPVVINKEMYWIASKQRTTSLKVTEEQIDHRFYTECHFIGFSAQKDPSAIYYLPKILQPDPLELNTSSDERKPNALPKRAISIDPIALKEDWQDDIKDDVLNLLQGKKVLTEDAEKAIEPENFLQRAVLCLACLPSYLRLQTSIGSGLSSFEESGVRMGHGVERGSVSPEQKVEDVLPDGLSPEQAEQHWQKLIQVLGPGPHTLQQVMKTADSVFAK